MQRDLSLSLHVLTARLDRGADRILQRGQAISYSRFLFLFMVSRGGTNTQRAVADRLGVTEPSVSRMTTTLVNEGLLRAGVARAGGNRRLLSLTPRGEAMVRRSALLLESRLVALVEASGVPYGQYTRHTKLLLEALDVGEGRTRVRAS
jgi:DNA-binding MarR family transcriptional regulator